MTWTKVCGNPSSYGQTIRDSMTRLLNSLGVTWEIVPLTTSTNPFASLDSCPTPYLAREVCGHSHGSKYRVILRRDTRQFVFHFWGFRYDTHDSVNLPSIYEALNAGAYEFVYLRNNNLDDYEDWRAHVGFTDTNKVRLYFQSWTRERRRFNAFFSAAEMNSMQSAFQGRY